MYNQSRKTHPDYEVIGYALMNAEKMTMKVTNNGGLIVLDEINKFQYDKDFIPIEISLEETIYIMVEHDGLYSFNKATFQKFRELAKLIDLDTKEVDFGENELVTINKEIFIQ